MLHMGCCLGPSPQLDEAHQSMDPDVTDGRICLSQSSESDWMRARTLSQVRATYKTMVTLVNRCCNSLDSSF